jgi:hypothetical protein
MSKLFYNLGLFLFIFLCIVGVICYKNFIVVKNFYFDPKINKVIMGDSHISCGVNDQLIPSTISVANTNESYIYTYYKLKKLLDTKAKIDTVFLGVGYHNFPASASNGTFNMVHRHIYFLPLHIINHIFKLKNSSSQSQWIPFLKLNFMNAGSFETQPYWGGYLSNINEKGPVKKDMDKRLQIQYYSNDPETLFSVNQIQYFEAIIDLCKQHSIVPIGLNMPLDPYYESNVPKAYKEKYLNLTKNIKVIDFKELNFSPKDFLPDGDHVSTKGAAKATLFLKNFIGR